MIIRRPASSELAAAIQWYDDQRPELGRRFETAVFRSLELITQLPHANLAIGNSIHRCVVNDFPYSIYYRDKPDQIVVYAIIHNRRDRRHIEQRLGTEDPSTDETDA